MSVLEISNQLGRGNIASRIGVTGGAVTEAIRNGAFPSSWFIAMRELGDERGVEVPEDLFRWKGKDLLPEGAA